MSAQAQRRTLHLARAEDAPVDVAPVDVARIHGESEAHYTARCRSIHALGTRWLRHPLYQFDPRHSANPEVWKPAFAAAWQCVYEAAAADRARNPAFKRAQAVRGAMGKS